MAGNGIQLGFPFERTTASPLDFFSKVADLTARDSIDPGIRYQGMTVFVISDQKTYQLQGGITNSDWKEFGTGGGGGANYIDSFTATASQTAFVLTEEPGVKQNIISVVIDGVQQNYASYSLATKTVTLDEAQPAGAVVEIRYNKATALTDVMKLKQPRYTELRAFGSTFNFNVNSKVIYIEGCGGGGGSAGSARGSANDATAGGNGTATTISGTNISVSFGGGGGSQKRVSPLAPPSGGAGGFTSFSGTAILSSWGAGGEAGEHGVDGSLNRGGAGGGSLFGRYGGRGGAAQAAGDAGIDGTGGGGGGATGEVSQSFSGGGGGGGGKGGFWLINPPASITVSTGSGGSAGSAGTAGYVGRQGGGGVVRIWEWE